MVYTDKHGAVIKIGDVLKWDEDAGPGYGRSIHEVIEIGGELFCVMRVGYPAWTELKDEEPIFIQYFCRPWISTECLRAEIIGHISDSIDVMTAEKAWELWPDEKRASEA